MQKRKSPLDVKEVPNSTLNKRTNPLELKSETLVTPTKTEKVSFVEFDIESVSKLKRKLTVTKISKLLLETIKEANPDKKTGVLLETAVLRYLHETQPEKYQEVVEKLSGKGNR